MPYSLACNNPAIEALVGKFESGKVTTLYGNAGSGKTTSCLLATISASRQGKVIYVDTEGGFDTLRLKQLYTEDIEAVLNQVFLIQPKTYNEQFDVIQKLHSLCSNPKISLVVVDTFGKHYRRALQDDAKEVNAMMIMQLQTLVRIARDMDKVVLVTNQVHANLKTKDTVSMVGGKPIFNNSKCVIELHKGDFGRDARLVRYKMENEKDVHPSLDKRIRFQIEEKGITLIN
ncbi:MAG: AAA family ATPase [Nanoarchaeota archaeon]|nr:AAA family ATPase [Nanoarchaeota archaeon]